MPPPTIRILLRVAGTAHKFLSIFVGKDNSLYFHPYRPHGQVWTTPRFSQTDGRISLDLVNTTEHEFNLNKISYHPTGIIHSTDCCGIRHKDGTRGPAFSEAPLPYDFATFAPCEPSRLPELKGQDGYNVIIDLPDHITPFYLNFSLIRSTCAPDPQPGPLIHHPLNLLFEDFDYGVSMTMWPVLKRDPKVTIDWPDAPFFLLRTAL